MAIKPPKNPSVKSDEDGEGKGGKGGGPRGSGFIPGFDELIAVSPEETEIAKLSKDAVFAQRVSLKSQGHKVSALDRKQELRNKLYDPRQGAELSGGTNLEEHPALPDMAGVFDDVVFPESEVEANQANNPDLALRNQLKARFGMGLSAQTLREELKSKEKLRARPKIAPEAKPEYVIRPVAPPPKPRPY